MGDNMENLKIYEIENSYVDYLVPFAPHLFHNKKEGFITNEDLTLDCVKFSSQFRS